MSKNRIRKEGEELFDDMKKLFEDYESRIRSERIKLGISKKKYDKKET